METFKEFIESTEGKEISEFISGDFSRKSQRWAYLAGFCRGMVQTWHFSKNGATEEDYLRMCGLGKRGVWRNIKGFFDEWYYQKKGGQDNV